jgi:GNAT superfamily N-acetyltransferase
MYELTPSQFALAQPLFEAAPYGALSAGTLEGGHPGRVFVDDPALPRAALVCTRVGYYFLAGQPNGGSFIDRMVDTFTTQLAPIQLQALGDPQVLLFYPSDDWQGPLLQAFGERGPVTIRKKRLLLDPAVAARGGKAFGCWRERLPAGFRLVRMSPSFFDEHPELAGETILFWGSEAAFAQRSLGLCLVDDNAGGVAAAAISGVFVGSGEIEISIATDPAYRRQGLGWLTAAAFIETCLRRGLSPVWGCFPENQASLNLAGKLGFVEDTDQSICFWEWKE